MNCRVCKNLHLQERLAWREYLKIQRLQILKWLKRNLGNKRQFQIFYSIKDISKMQPHKTVPLPSGT